MRAGFCVLLAGVASPAPAAQDDAMLTVAAVSGAAEVERLGEHHLLQAGELLAERDVLRLGDDGHLGLRLAQSGVLELGPHAELSIEKLPSGKSRKDRKSIFNLAHGYLRIAWAPTDASAAPLYLYFGAQRARIDEGEYFFEGAAASARVCVASGELAVTPISGSSPHALNALACYHLKGVADPENLAHGASVWPAMRRNFTLNLPIVPQAEAASGAAVPSQNSDVPETAAATTKGSAEPARDAATPAARASSPSMPIPSTSHADHADAGAHSGNAVLPLVKMPAVPAVADGSWAINVASYADRALADQQIAEIQRDGYPAVIQTVQRDGHDWYRVQVRGFVSSEDAQKRLRALKAKPGYASAWIVRVP